jgi:squalene-hopene/tetraprenyl-beta-curcumene cyclase
MDRVSEGIASSVDWLLGQQHEQGYWCGELEADSMLEADYIFMHTLLGTGDRGKMERASTRFCATRTRTADGACIRAARPM